VAPFQAHYFSENTVAPRIELGTSAVARNSDQQTTTCVFEATLLPINIKKKKKRCASVDIFWAHQCSMGGMCYRWPAGRSNCLFMFSARFHSPNSKYLKIFVKGLKNLILYFLKICNSLLVVCVVSHLYP
jgi:hypothetical protein